MQYLAIAVALSALLVPSLAAPAQTASEATDDYQWSVTKWQFGRGQSAYDYSFNVAGAKNGKVPGFTASCSGTQVGGYTVCTLNSSDGKFTPTISANVNIVQDPNNPNDNIPRVFVQETYTDQNE